MLFKIDYHSPSTIAEVCALKKKLGQNAVIMAGGTDVIAKLHDGKHHYDHLIDIKDIAGLSEIRMNKEGGLDIGALVTHHMLETDEAVLSRYSIIEQGVKTIGSLQVRNRGTLGGNLCTAAPSADAIGPLLVLNSECVIQGENHIRTIPLEKFFSGPKKSVLESDEILVKVVVPPVPEQYRGVYFKYGRRNAMEIALMNISIYLEVEADGRTCSEIRIALGTSAPTPIRARKTEAFLLGGDLGDKNFIQKAGEIVQTDASPRSSWRSSEEFRRKLLKNLVPRTIVTAYDRWKGEYNV